MVQPEQPPDRPMPVPPPPPPPPTTMPQNPAQKVQELNDGTRPLNNPFPTCPPMSATSRAFRESHVRNAPPDGFDQTINEFMAHHPSPQHSHGSGQSPASMDLSDTSAHNVHTPSSSSNNNVSSGTSSYSPMTYEDYNAAAMRGIPVSSGGPAAPPLDHGGYPMPKDVLDNWEMLGLDPALGTVPGINMVSNGEFTDFWAESTA